MFRPNKQKIASFRADYADHGDYCQVFEQDMKCLYLLAFLLTANHKESEQCFVSTVEEAFKEQAVFKDWARSWVKRRMPSRLSRPRQLETDRNGISGVQGNRRHKKNA